MPTIYIDPELKEVGKNGQDWCWQLAFGKENCLGRSSPITNGIESDTNKYLNESDITIERVNDRKGRLNGLVEYIAGKFDSENYDNVVVSTHQHRLGQLFELFGNHQNLGFKNCSLIRLFIDNGDYAIQLVYAPESGSAKVKYRYLDTGEIEKLHIKPSESFENLPEIYFIRHGEAFHNLEPKIVGVNSPLTLRGIEQANGLRTANENLFEDRRTAYITSPLDRTIHTLMLSIPELYKKLVESGDFFLKTTEERNRYKSHLKRELMGHPTEDAEELMGQPAEDEKELMGQPAEDEKELMGQPTEDEKELMGRPAENEKELWDLIKQLRDEEEEQKKLIKQLRDEEEEQTVTAVIGGARFNKGSKRTRRGRTTRRSRTTMRRQPSRTRRRKSSRRSHPSRAKRRRTRRGRSSKYRR